MKHSTSDYEFKKIMNNVFDWDICYSIIGQPIRDASSETKQQSRDSLRLILNNKHLLNSEQKNSAEYWVEELITEPELSNRGLVGSYIEDHLERCLLSVSRNLSSELKGFSVAVVANNQRLNRRVKYTHMLNKDQKILCSGSKLTNTYKTDLLSNIEGQGMDCPSCRKRVKKMIRDKVNLEEELMITTDNYLKPLIIEREESIKWLMNSTEKIPEGQVDEYIDNARIMTLVERINRSREKSNKSLYAEDEVSSFIKNLTLLDDKLETNTSAMSAIAERDDKIADFFKEDYSEGLSLYDDIQREIKDKEESILKNF